MQRFYAEQTGASWCVRDYEIVTPLGPARGKPMLVQLCSGQALAESLAKMLNETRGAARDEPRCVECGAQPAGGDPLLCASCHSRLARDRGVAHDAERAHLQATCRVCGVQVDEADSTTALMRKLIMHLAAQEPIVIAPDEEA